MMKQIAITMIVAGVMTVKHALFAEIALDTTDETNIKDIYSVQSRMEEGHGFQLVRTVTKVVKRKGL